MDGPWKDPWPARASATRCPTAGPWQGVRDPGRPEAVHFLRPLGGSSQWRAPPTGPPRAEGGSELGARPPSGTIGPAGTARSARLLPPRPPLASARPAASSALGWAVPRAPRPGGGTVRPSRPGPVIDQQRLLSLLMVRLGGN